MKPLILLTSLLFCPALYAAQLELPQGSGSRTWQTEELLGQAQTITVKDDVSYKRDMTYRAVPMAVLLQGIKADDHLQAVALDGLAAGMAPPHC